jgi:Fe2+ transport system protein FeoA
VKQAKANRERYRDWAGRCFFPTLFFSGLFFSGPIANPTEESYDTGMIVRFNLIYLSRLGTLSHAVANMFELIPLRCLRPGQTGEVGQVVGDPQQVHRLQELGLRQGTRVEMVQAGSPCIIRTAGSKLCFRQSETLGVLVRPGGDV